MTIFDQVNAMNSLSVVKILGDDVLVTEVEKIITTRGTITDTRKNIVTTNPLRKQRQWQRPNGAHIRSLFLQTIATMY